MRLVAILALGVLPLSAFQEGQDKAGVTRTVTVREGETVVLKLRMAEAGKNFLGVLTLPEAVAHVVSAWDPKDLSVEHESNRLFLKLLTKSEGHLDVVTAGGSHFRFLLAPAEPGSPYDSNVIVRTAGSEVRAREEGGAGGALELVRAMRLGLIPPDATVRSGKNEVLYFSPAFEVGHLYTYETGRFRGDVLRLSNKSPGEAVYVDVTRWTGERLVLIGSKDVVVPPGKSTRLYVVDWK